MNVANVVPSASQHLVLVCLHNHTFKIALEATIALHFALCSCSVPTRNSQMETACGHELYNSLLSHQDTTAGFLKPWKSKAGS